MSYDYRQYEQGCLFSPELCDEVVDAVALYVLQYPSLRDEGLFTQILDDDDIMTLARSYHDDQSWGRAPDREILDSFLHDLHHLTVDEAQAQAFGRDQGFGENEVMGKFYEEFLRFQDFLEKWRMQVILGSQSQNTALLRREFEREIREEPFNRNVAQYIYDALSKIRPSEDEQEPVSNLVRKVIDSILQGTVGEELVCDIADRHIAERRKVLGVLHGGLKNIENVKYVDWYLLMFDNLDALTLEVVEKFSTGSWIVPPQDPAPTLNSASAP